MAEADDKNWQDFLDATELDDDEVETSSEEDENLEDEEADDKDDAKKKSAPEKGKKGDDAEEEESDEDEDDPDKDEKKAEDDLKKDEKKPDPEAYQPRLKQFLNDKGELDPKKMEEAYIESSKEGVKLKGQVDNLTGQVKELLAAINKDPETAKKLLGEEAAKKLADDQPAAPLDPVQAHFVAKLNKEHKEQYNEFVEQHPESVSDPDKAEKISKFFKFYGPWYKETNDGEIATMKDSLEAAYRHYGWDVEIKKKEDVASAAKKNAATRSTAHSKKPSSKSGFSKEEMKFASKLGVKL